MTIMKEFKEFAVKGNALDLAIGVIIGAEFGKIVASLVSDIIMPPIGQLIGGVQFSSLFWSLNGQVYATLQDAKVANAPVIAYGSFIETIFRFLIVVFSVFMMVKLINKMKKEEVEKKS